MTEGTALEVTILRPNHFCVWTNPQTKASEIGVAHGYFAGDMFAKTTGDEYITKVSGRSFGWMDTDGSYWKCDKSEITRPSTEQLIQALSEPNFRKICIELELVEEKKVKATQFEFDGPHPDNVWMN